MNLDTEEGRAFLQKLAETSITDLIDRDYLRKEMVRLSRGHLQMNGFPDEEAAKLTDDEAIWVANEHMATFLGMRG